MNRSLVAQQIVTVVAIVSTVIVNVLANALPIAGRTTGDISDSFEVFFVPAGYVFSIWGLIYLGLVAFAVYQALPSQRSNPRIVPIRNLVILSCLANMTWIFLWHNLLFGWTMALMLLLLVSLIAIYLRLVAAGPPETRADRWAVDAVFSLYLGWISVATIANATVLLDDAGWSGFGVAGETWAILLLVVGVVLGALLSARHQDWIYCLVLAWAFAGIGVSQAGTSVAMPAYAASLAALACAAWALWQGTRRPEPLAGAA